MKPLAKKDRENFLKRFDDFKDADPRSIDIVSSAIIKITFAVQDSARAFDWITITLEFNGVDDASLLENTKLPYIDMSEGITLLCENDLFCFAIGNYNNLSAITNSICYIKADSLKYKEDIF